MPLPCVKRLFYLTQVKLKSSYSNVRGYEMLLKLNHWRARMRWQIPELWSFCEKDLGRLYTSCSFLLFKHYCFQLFQSGFENPTCTSRWAHARWWRKNNMIHATHLVRSAMRLPCWNLLDRSTSTDTLLRKGVCWSRAAIWCNDENGPVNNGALGHHTVADFSKDNWHSDRSALACE